MAVWKVAPALATGNTVVLKPSSNTPLTALLLAEVASEVLPDGLINVVCGDRQALSALLPHPVPRQLGATASTESGIAIAGASLAHVKRLHLGLTGKAPALVLADADLDAVTETLCTAAFLNAGQDCTAASRVLVENSVHDELVQRLTARAATVFTGPPSDTTAFYGPLNSSRQRDGILSYLHDLPSHQHILTGGKAPDRPGWFLQPTIVAGVRAGDDLCHKELFGPVMSIERFDDLYEAVHRLNSSPYGLACSVHTSHHATAMKAAASLDYGCVWVNTHLPLVSEMPHSGHKQSGFGYDLSTLALDEYTRAKHIMHRIA